MAMGALPANPANANRLMRIGMQGTVYAQRNRKPISEPVVGEYAHPKLKPKEKMLAI
jgi:hypothetical protein